MLTRKDQFVIVDFGHSRALVPYHGPTTLLNFLWWLGSSFWAYTLLVKLDPLAQMSSLAVILSLCTCVIIAITVECSTIAMPTHNVLMLDTCCSEWGYTRLHALAFISSTLDKTYIQKFTYVRTYTQCDRKLTKNTYLILFRFSAPFRLFIAGLVS